MPGLGTPAQSLPYVAVSSTTVHAAEDNNKLALNAIPECVLEAPKQHASVSSIHVGGQERILCYSRDCFVN